MADPGQRPLLPRLTALRWYAALLVMLHHIPDVMRWNPPSWIPDSGTMGVSFFFVLSGFVLTWSYRGGARDFYLRRIARIYPATVVSIVIAAVIIMAGMRWMRGGPLGLVYSLLLVQSWFPQAHYPVYAYNTVTWTLSCEAFFYLLLPIILRACTRWRTRRILTMTALALGLGVTTDTLLAIAGGNWASNGVHQPLLSLPEFLLGMSIGVAVVRGWRPRVNGGLAVLIYLAGFAVSPRLPGPVFVYAYLPGTAAILCSCIRADLDGRRGLLTARFSVYLGELSFCFYLLHVMVDRLVAHWAGFMGAAYSTAGGLPIVALLLACSAFAAALLHHFVELPMQRRLRPRPVASHARALTASDTIGA